MPYKGLTPAGKLPTAVNPCTLLVPSGALYIGAGAGMNPCNPVYNPIEQDPCGMK